MNYLPSLTAFFNRFTVDPIADTAYDAFSAACDTYDAAFRATESYSKRANHHSVILAARSALYRSSRNDSHAADIYDETVAAFSDPADFAPYTETELNAHTVAIETLSVAFDNIAATFAGLKPADHLYPSAAALHKAICDTYAFAADAYSDTVHCAMAAALAGNLQSVKDEFQVTLLEDIAANPASAKAKSAAFKIKAAENAAEAKALEKKARLAEAKAEVFCTKAKSVKAKVEATFQNNAENGVGGSR